MISGSLVGLFMENPRVVHTPIRKPTMSTFSKRLTNHVCCLTKGPRFVSGDWNVSQYDIPVFGRLEAAGFRDIQDIANQFWGMPVQPTCKQVTRRDFCYISPELQQLLCKVEVYHDIGPDHAVLKGIFHSPSKSVPKQVWCSPASLPWPHEWEVDAQFWNNAEGPPAAKYQAMWKHIEDMAAAAVPFPVPAAAKGRGRTMATKAVLEGRMAPPSLPAKVISNHSLCVPHFATPSGCDKLGGCSLTADMCACMILTLSMPRAFGELLSVPRGFHPPSRNGGPTPPFVHMVLLHVCH